MPINGNQPSRKLLQQSLFLVLLTGIDGIKDVRLNIKCKNTNAKVQSKQTLYLVDKNVLKTDKREYNFKVRII